MIRKAQKAHRKTKKRLDSPKNTPANSDSAEKIPRVSRKTNITNEKVTNFFICPTLIFIQNWYQLRCTQFRLECIFCASSGL